MIFKDRIDAGGKLADAISKDKTLLKDKKQLLVLSLVRGGAVVGGEVCRRLKLLHYPVMVKKIGAPHNEELAIGALCNGDYYLDTNLIKRLNISDKELSRQIREAKQKQKEYQKKFKIKRLILKKKRAIIVDDGIATGSSMRAVLKYLRIRRVEEVILAVPVAPNDFDSSGFDKVFILHQDPFFNAVSQFYQQFDQVSDREAKKYFK